MTKEREESMGIKVMIADDHVLIREGIKQLLNLMEVSK